MTDSQGSTVGARSGQRGRPPASSRDGHLTGVLSRLRGVYPNQSRSGQKVSDYILSHPQDIIHASVSEVASGAGVSDATVVRLCQRTGYTGFQDLKVSLARDLIEPIKLIHEDVDPDDDVATIADKVFRSDIHALRETLKVLDKDALERVTTLVVDAERVEFYGVGFSALVALDASYRMQSLGIQAVARSDSHMQAVSAALTGPGVAVISISHSGSSKESVDVLRIAREAGARTVCITNFVQSPITAYAEVVLQTVAPETMFRSEAMASRIAELSIVDALYVCVGLARIEESLESLDRVSDALATRRF
ncbi:MAG: MurR/RpiR family transcriptional regulator [Anaerolineae bacterium]|nr:MurR/RpiR family transcriptional regulator [Anaerolineae bacterium]